MKIRDLILGVLIVGIILSTGILVAFTSIGVNSIEDITSEASSDVLVSTGTDNLENIAIGIRDSLDNQMQNQYEMVKTWAKSPTLLNAAKNAQSYSKEELYEMWSAEATRQYDEGEAVGDGNTNNDLDPAASSFLKALSTSTAYPELFITDARGYAIAASAATGDFDQGPDDWRVFLENDTPVFKKHDPAEGGEGWYRDANKSPDGLFIGEVEWDDSAMSWGVDIVSQLRDPVTNAYLGQIKAVFNYGESIDQLVNSQDLEVYEIKVAGQDGAIVGTSLDDKTKVNNENVSVQNSRFFDAVKAGAISGSEIVSETDENGQVVYTGYAISSDVNQHIIVVSKKATDLEGPIVAFTNGLQTQISDKSSAIQRNMIIIGVIVALVILLVAFFIMRAKITRPLNKLTEVSEKLTQGDIDGLEVDVSGSDEIGQFGKSFKGVLAAFNMLMEEAENKKSKGQG